MMTDISHTPSIITLKLSDSDDNSSVFSTLITHFSSPLMIFDFTNNKRFFLHFSEKIAVSKLDICLPIPQLKITYCKNCGKCTAFCPSKALQKNPLNGIIRLQTDLCNACWNCLKICNVKNALIKSSKNIGQWEFINVSEHRIYWSSLKKSHQYASAILNEWNFGESAIILIYNSESILRLIKKHFNVLKDLRFKILSDEQFLLVEN